MIILLKRNPVLTLFLKCKSNKKYYQCIYFELFKIRILDNVDPRKCSALAKNVC